ncbi:MAG: HD domain-containing protein [Arenicellales bacterium]
MILRKIFSVVWIKLNNRSQLFMDLVEKAKQFATTAHKRINHQRKYNNQPYTVHLSSVANIVSTVTDDQEMIAAAWLHDVVEDTPATLYDVEQEFGKDVAELVENLTDISKPGDGNRQVRKLIDRQHIAVASQRAKTIKLADLIDNANDISSNDAKFAELYLQEMNALLEVLDEGDTALYKRAWKTHHKCTQKLKSQQKSETPADINITSPAAEQNGNHHLFRLFSEAFTAQHLAEPVRSFDASRPCKEVQAMMELHQLDIVCLREQGTIVGYARHEDLIGKSCRENMRVFREGQVIPGESPFSDVIHVLTLQQYGFISVLGEIAGVFSRQDINKPVARMWLFGIITFVEMDVMKVITQYFPDDSWQSALTQERLDRAKALQEERNRRGQHCSLLDCIQLSDKGKIIISKEETLALSGLESRRSAKKVVREMESLRNNLAHAQDIVTYDWGQIVRLTQRLEESLNFRA